MRMGTGLLSLKSPPRGTAPGPGKDQERPQDGHLACVYVAHWSTADSCVALGVGGNLSEPTPLHKVGILNTTFSVHTVISSMQN